MTAIIPNTTHHVTSINILFSDEDSVAIRQLSEAMNLNFGTFIPHMTLLHAPNDAANYFHSLLAEVDLPPEVIVEGVEFNPEIEQGVIWVSLQVRKTTHLMNMRRHLLETAADVVETDLTVDNYWPHITLGCVPVNEVGVIHLNVITEVEYLRTLKKLAIKVGRNGEYGKVIESVV